MNHFHKWPPCNFEKFKIVVRPVGLAGIASGLVERRQKVGHVGWMTS